jgi:hypothetical protein
MTFWKRRQRQELYCHACDKHVQFVIDMTLDGNHVLNCPNCGHEHCRVVKESIITDDRWDQRNGDTFPAYRVIGSSTTPIYTSMTYTSIYIATSTSGSSYS